ncbi:MAG: leucyl aminopeptidase [Bacteroidetes bacterium]|jgi:leucyl aminopeptidase|nr:leucyl aminopeptidase [Bacteroidota bacterium]
MKVSATSIPLTDLDVDFLLLPLAQDALGTMRATLAETLGPMAERAMQDFSGEEGEAISFYPDGARARRAALIGLGAADAVDAERLRQAAATGAKLAVEREAQNVAVRLPAAGPPSETAGQALTEGFMLATYRFLKYKTEPAAFVEPDRLILHVDEDDRDVRRGAERGRAVAEAVRTARDLVNLSPDEKTPTLLARAVEKLGKKHGFEVSVWDKALIEEEEMGGLLAVNRGSPEPPVFMELTWRPERAANETPVVLVGKGVVFDTGGLSLKSTKGSMDQMKADMAGAAAVIGAFEALARLDVPLYVVGLIPATDNRPGENAYVPGDVLRMHSGKTVEVLNTDAEGRLILADALSYAATYRPDLVIDLATLTGGQVVALGSDTAALMTNDRDGAADRLTAMEAAGRRSGDWVHRLPMDAVYGKLLESDVADIKNVGGREASSITAAKFLEHFVDYPWMHLDIAGPAFLATEKPYRPKGGTGFGVRVLVDFLRDYASPKKVR